MPRPISLGALTLLLIGTTACGNTKAAEEAIARADRFYTGMQEEAAKVMPEAVKRLADTLQKAKDHLAAGDGTAAQAAAVEAAGEAVRLAKLVPRKRVELDSIYKAVSREVTYPVQQTVAKVRQLNNAGRIPPGVTRAAFDSVKTVIAAWEGDWKAATEDYQKGQLAAAANKANAVKSSVIAAMRMLGVK